MLYWFVHFKCFQLPVFKQCNCRSWWKESQGWRNGSRYDLKTRFVCLWFFQKIHGVFKRNTCYFNLYWESLKIEKLHDELKRISSLESKSLWQKYYHETVLANRSDQPVGLLGHDFSNIWYAILISSSLHYCKVRWSMLRDTAVTKQWTAKWPYFANVVFWIVKKHWE